MAALIIQRNIPPVLFLDKKKSGKDKQVCGRRRRRERNRASSTSKQKISSSEKFFVHFKCNFKVILQFSIETDSAGYLDFSFAWQRYRGREKREEGEKERERKKKKGEKKENTFGVLCVCKSSKQTE